MHLEIAVTDRFTFLHPFLLEQSPLLAVVCITLLPSPCAIDFLTLDCFKKREPGVKIDKAERRRRENELSLAKQLLQQSLEFEKHHDGHGMAAIFGIHIPQ